MSFVSPWIDLEIIIPSKVSQTKTNIIYHLYVESFKKMIQMNLYTKKKKNRPIYIENKLMVTKGEMRGGTN